MLKKITIEELSRAMKMKMKMKTKIHEAEVTVQTLEAENRENQISLIGVRETRLRIITNKIKQKLT